MAGEAKACLLSMRWKTQATDFGRGGVRDGAFDANCTGATCAVTPTMDRASDPGIQREPRAQKDDAQVRSVRTLDRSTPELNGRHALAPEPRTAGFRER